MKSFLAILLFAVLPAVVQASPDCEVVEAGHANWGNAGSVPTLTVVINDPENSIPVLRHDSWVVTHDAILCGSNVDVNVGKHFACEVQTLRVSLRSGAAPTLVIHYIDQKNHKRLEYHGVITELGPRP
jgi:hypothetical protein